MSSTPRPILVGDSVEPRRRWLAPTGVVGRATTPAGVVGRARTPAGIVGRARTPAGIVGRARNGGVVLVAIFALTSGCAHYSQQDGEKLAGEVFVLQAQVKELQQTLDSVEKREEEQQRQLAVMTRDVGSLSKNARRNDADLGVELDEMKELVGRLRGLVQGFDERVSELETKSSKVQEELEVRFQGLAEQQKIDKAKTESEKRQAIATARERERLLSNPTKALQEAESLLDKAEAEEARLLVRELLIRHKSNRSFRKRQPQAQFLIGESYFKEDNFQQAAAEYNTVRKKYPRSKYVPQALYKLGLCFENLKLMEDAKLFYTTVVQKYGKYKVAKEAKARLKKLK